MFIGIILFEFLCLILLGLLLLRLIYWESCLRENRAAWLARLRAMSSRLRRVRQQLQDAGHGIPGLELSPGNRRKLQLVRWMGQAVIAAGRARP